MTSKQIDALPVARLDADSCKALKAAASVEESRPILNHLLVREGYAEACNGRVLCRVPLMDATGEEFSLPEEIRDRRWLVHRAALDHVKAGHSLEIDMRTGECWVVGKAGEEGYPIELPQAQTEAGVGKWPNTDAVVPSRKNGHRAIALGAPVLKAMLAFAGSGKYAGSLQLLVPEEDDEEGCVVRAVSFSRRGVTARSGVVMPMRIIDRFEAVGGDEDSARQGYIEGTEPPEGVDPETGEIAEDDELEG